MTTHKTESTRLPLRLSHIKGIYSIDRELLSGSVQRLLLRSSGGAATKKRVLTDECDNNGGKKHTQSTRRICKFVPMGAHSAPPPPKGSITRRSASASCFTNSHRYSLTRTRQRLGEAEKSGVAEEQKVWEKKERNTVSCWGLKKGGEREKGQARANSSIEKGEQLLPQTPIHTPTSAPRNPQIPSSPPFSPPSPL